MELTQDISAEQLPSPEGSREIGEEPENQGLSLRTLSDEDIKQKIEQILLERIQRGDDQSLFQLGQLYYEQEEYEKAQVYFEKATEKEDLQGTFQLGVMLYDGLGGKVDRKRGFVLMMKVATSNSRHVGHLIRAAQFNIGRAYFQGFGVRQSDDNAERFWLLAADDGNPKASVKAQSILGMYYSREETRDLKKAFFWHSEACGNGSLESQGALGVMYLNGLGTRKDTESAFVCFRDAAERGNVFSMGNLVAHYYKAKLYTKTIEMAARVAQFDNIEQLAEETDCLPSYIAKGISLASFYYARCLRLGLAVKVDPELEKYFYSRSYQFDPDTCARLQDKTQKGEI